MSINDATPQDWDRVRETGEPTFEEYQKRLKFSWVHDGTKPAPQTAYREDLALFGDCWDVKKPTMDEQMKVYLDAAEEERDAAAYSLDKAKWLEYKALNRTEEAAEEELNKSMKETEWWKQHVARAEQQEYEARWGKEDADWLNFDSSAYKFEEETEEECKEDVVNNPSHYNTGSIECIEGIQASMSAEAFNGYLKGNCMKYLWRYDYKGKPVEDLQKAQWYLAELIKELLFEDED